MKPTLVILAAGLGSRYGGVKQMDPIGPSGENIIDYSVYDAIRAGFGRVVFVINAKIEQEFKEVYDERLKGKIVADYVIQDLHDLPKGAIFNPERVKPWGTGHAILAARDIVEEPFAVLNADDFYGRQAFEVMYKHLSALKVQDTQYAMVGFQLKNTLSENGSVSRGICQVNNGLLTDVVERTKIIRKGNQVFDEAETMPLELNENSWVSMNFWGFTPRYFEQSQAYFTDFVRENAQNIKAEFYIPYVTNLLINENKATVKVLESRDQWFGVTYREDKEETIQKVREMIVEGSYPENLWK
ncbi:MAG: NTP transferase domain-containing protein [Bacteroidales bacterium]|nr:NTP transferase domain-containing protein [Bacteroidales bacterium]